MTTSLPRNLALLIAGLCSITGACAITPPSSPPIHTSVSASPGTQTGIPNSATVEPSIFTNPPSTSPAAAQLYARDGSVVGPAGQGVTPPEQGALASRGVGDSENGRMYLLELYQQVIDERDSLNREVYALRADLEALQDTQTKDQARMFELEQQILGLNAEQERLRTENLDLAARLTTAQIRRLQAERLLLEHKIAEQQVRDTAQAEEAQPEGQQP